MKFPTIFKSQRLSATPIQFEDWPGLLHAVTSEQFPRELGLASHTTEEAAKNWHLARVKDWNNNNCFVWSIRWHDKSEVIGQLSLVPREHDIALAYWVNPELWGQGVVTEILKSLMLTVYESGYKGDIWAAAHSWNARSLSVLVKLGFKFQKDSQYRSNNGKMENLKEYLLSVGK